MTSNCVSVKMDVDPNKVVHTSPEMLADEENLFIIK